MLHACHDSRIAALRRWQLRFGFLDESLPHPPKVFFDFETDILYFGTKFAEIEHFVNGADAVECSELRRIALNMRVQRFRGRSTANDFTIFLHHNFGNLEHIVCVERFHPKYWDASMVNDASPVAQTRLISAIKHAIYWRSPVRSDRYYWVRDILFEYKSCGWTCPIFSIVLDPQRAVANHGNWSHKPLEHIYGVS